MSKETLTDWFPPHIKPVRVGRYHTGCGSCDPRYNEESESPYNWWWDGEGWRAFPNYPQQNEFQDRWWRGIAK